MSLLAINQSQTNVNYLLICEIFPTLESFINRQVSSAKRTKSISLEDLSMSFIYKRKRTGPSTDPCGTPHRILRGDEISPATEILWTRSVRYDSNHLLLTPLIP